MARIARRCNSNNLDRVLEMKHNLFGPLMLLLLYTNAAFCLGSVVKKDYKYHSFPLSWEDARRFCSGKFTDLATIYTHSDVNNLNVHYNSWIGLNRNGPQRNEWVWSDGLENNVNNLLHNMENATGDCAMVIYKDQNRIYIRNCNDHRFFMCQKSNQLSNDYQFIPEAKTWEEARKYCTTKYYDLASFTSSFLNYILTEQEFPIWIGMHKDEQSWSWTSGVSEYDSWTTGEPSTEGDCGSISSVTKMMAPKNCTARFPFLCILDSVVLVKEKKSWEEALEHCRGLRSTTNKDFRYDFLSLQPNDPHDFVLNKVMQADTEEVWAGLRFLAGEWMWVNGADMLYTDLPRCPTRWQHCGILSKSSAGSMEARDCSERKNFLCYSYTP